MKQFKFNAAKFSINALLSCSAAVLLSACGGNVDPAGEQLAATAAVVSTDEGAAPATVPAALPPASLEAAPAGVSEAAAVAPNQAPLPASAGATPTAGTGPAAAASTQAFELSGYGGERPQPGQEEAGAKVPEPVKH